MLMMKSPTYQISIMRTLILFWMYFCIFLTENAFAANALDEDYNYAKQIKLNILRTLEASMDAGRVNRISVTNNQITEVIGDTEEFSYEIDSKGNVFISPSIVAGESFEVAINLDNGKTQSLRFNVRDIGYGQTIILNDEDLSFSLTSLNDRIVEIIKAVKLDELDLVDRLSLKKQFSVLGGLEQKIFDIARVREVKVLGDVKSFVVEIISTSGSFIDFQEKDLLWTKGKIIAVALDRKSPDSNLEAIIVAMEDGK